MALHPIPPRTFDDWHTAISYGGGFRRIYGPKLLDDPAFRLVIGYLDGEPVTGAAAIISDGVVGVSPSAPSSMRGAAASGPRPHGRPIHAGMDAGCYVAMPT
jgi:hypothetical protein